MVSFVVFSTSTWNTTNFVPSWAISGSQYSAVSSVSSSQFVTQIFKVASWTSSPRGTSCHILSSGISSSPSNDSDMDSKTLVILPLITAEIAATSSSDGVVIFHVSSTFSHRNVISEVTSPNSVASAFSKKMVVKSSSMVASSAPESANPRACVIYSPRAADITALAST